MLLFPKSFKYKKLQKGIPTNKISNPLVLKDISTNSIKLISLTHGRIKSKQLTAVKFLIKKSIKKLGFVRFQIFPHKSITKKPAEIRMGKGKGSVDHWVCNIKVGVTICELNIKSKYRVRAFNALKKAQIRLPLLTKIVR